jgi:UDP-glucose:(heptosyl)LPS alpha-1,3-glucosyltransferase
MSFSIYQIVRRFEPIGGMESYVWNLSHALKSAGIDVRVVCEVASKDVGMPVITLGRSMQRRRWKAMDEFGHSVSEFFSRAEESSGVIIHSHERTAVHDVTTIHGPLMLKIENQSLVKRLFSERIKFWCRAEISEICGPQVKAVLPVSDLWRQKIEGAYPCTKNKFVGVACPGVSASQGLHFDEASSSVRVVFVGKEWKRKGLPFAITVCDALIKSGYLCTLDIFGVEERQVKINRNYLRYRGYVSDVPFRKYDVLIHPAKVEPYGMIVAEALLAGCRVLASDQVGAIMLKHPFLESLSLDESVSQWADKLKSLVKQSGKNEYLFKTWSDLASFHIDSVYSHVIKQKKI